MYRELGVLKSLIGQTVALSDDETPGELVLLHAFENAGKCMDLSASQNSTFFHEDGYWRSYQLICFADR